MHDWIWLINHDNIMINNDDNGQDCLYAYIIDSLDRFINQKVSYTQFNAVDFSFLLKGLFYRLAPPPRASRGFCWSSDKVLEIEL